MAGTKAGAIKARNANLASDPDFYKKIGSIGGSREVSTKGFGYRWPCNCSVVPERHHRAQCVGKKGGQISKRGQRVKAQ